LAPGVSPEPEFQLQLVVSDTSTTIMKWINALDVDRWADRLDSRSRLPELIRRLAHATVDHPRKVDCPSEESTQLSGWDGILEIDETHPFIPIGYSGWEFTTKQDVKGKADEDYSKRTSDSGMLDRAKTAFVFVTPRRWQGKRSWIERRLAEKKWADVRAFDADDLEQWLEIAPAVGAWLAVLIGKYPAGARSLTDLWMDFSRSTNPPIPKELLTAGRAAAIAKVTNWLAGAPSALKVEGDSSAEALAFVGASLLSLKEAEAEHWFSRAVGSTETMALHQMSTTRHSLLIMWLSDDQGGVGSALAGGHRVVIPSGRGGSGNSLLEESPGLVSLPTIPSEEFVKNLVAAGVSQDRAEYLSRETVRRIPILQRRIPAAGSLLIPEWAKPENAQAIKPILLANSWVASNSYDRDAVADLGETEYVEIEKIAARWALESDSPVRRVGNEWGLVSPLDAWHLLSRSLTVGDLDRLTGVIVRVLTVEDPALELAPADRWMRAIHNKMTPHSLAMRSGLAQTLCLLGVVGHRAGLSAGGNAQMYVDGIVWRLLGGSPGWKRWYSLSQLLPLLAEASPDSFLRALEDELSAPTTQVVQLFTEEGWMAQSVHTGLLWALECLAWFPEFLGRVTVLLGKLAIIDPGGRLENRPGKSLRDIFLPWHPQTTATRGQRLQALDLLLTKMPDIGWKLLISLLPKNHDFATQNYEPRWREQPATMANTPMDYYTTFDHIVQKAVTWAGNDFEKLAEVLPESATFTPAARAALLANVRRYAEATADSPERTRLWGTLRDMVNRHRKYTGADWALPENELKAIDPVVTLLEPRSPIKRAEWLFNEWHPDLATTLDVVAAQLELDAARQRATEAIQAECGLDGVLWLARGVKLPQFVGTAVAGLPSAPDFADEFLTATLATEEKPLQITGLSFADRLIRKLGQEWTEHAMDRLFPGWTDHARANFYRAMPSGRSTWMLVDAAGPEVKRLYWKEVFSLEVLKEDAEEMGEGLRHLLEYGRPGDALDIAAHKTEKLPSEMLIRVLDSVGEEFRSSAPQGVRADLGYDLERLLNALRSRDDVAESELIRLEWFFLPILGRGGEKPAKALQSHILKEPEFFVQLVRWAYLPRQGGEVSRPDQAPSQEEISRARQAYGLLHSLRSVPGLRQDGTLDSVALNAWVERAREMCAVSGHTEIGDEEIGHLLAWCPGDPDGTWPMREVRDLLEWVESRHLEIGFEIATTNKRGVTFRNPREGGQQERSLAQTYWEWADRTATGWPRASAVLRSLSRGYENQGRMEDEHSQRWDLRT